MNNNLIVTINETLLATLKKMDDIKRKLLIVKDDNGKYIDLISIGDIQRAIISGVDLTSPISMIKIDKKEIINSKWCTLNLAQKVITYEQSIKTLKKANKIIITKNLKNK